VQVGEFSLQALVAIEVVASPLKKDAVAKNVCLHLAEGGFAIHVPDGMVRPALRHVGVSFFIVEKKPAEVAIGLSHQLHCRVLGGVDESLARTLKHLTRNELLTALRCCEVADGHQFWWLWWAEGAKSFAQCGS